MESTKPAIIRTIRRRKRKAQKMTLPSLPIFTWLRTIKISRKMAYLSVQKKRYNFEKNI